MAYADIDLGLGYGVPLVHCNLSDVTYNSSRGMFMLKAPQIYDVEFPYTCVKERQETISLTPLTPNCTTIRITPYLNSQYDLASAYVAPVRIVYGKGFSKHRSNQRTQTSWSGVINTFDSNLTFIKGSLSIRGLSKDDGKRLDDFMSDVLFYNKNKFIVEVFE